MYESSGAGRLKTLREQSGLTQQELSRRPAEPDGSKRCANSPD